MKARQENYSGPAHLVLQLPLVVYGNSHLVRETKQLSIAILGTGTSKMEACMARCGQCRHLLAKQQSTAGMKGVLKHRLRARRCGDFTSFNQYNHPRSQAQWFISILQTAKEKCRIRQLVQDQIRRSKAGRGSQVFEAYHQCAFS